MSLLLFVMWLASFKKTVEKLYPGNSKVNSQPFGDQSDLQVLLAQEETEYVVSWERKSVTIYQAQLPLICFYYRKKKKHNTHLDCNCLVFYNFIIVKCCIDLLALSIAPVFGPWKFCSLFVIQVASVYNTGEPLQWNDRDDSGKTFHCLSTLEGVFPRRERVSICHPISVADVSVESWMAY